MVKLIIAASLTLLGVVAGGIAADLGASPAVIAIVGIVVTAGATLQGEKAVTVLVALIPQKAYDEIVLYGNAFLVIVNGGQLAVLSIPIWLHAAIVGVSVLFVTVFQRSRATPLSNPRTDGGVPLVPFATVQTSSTSGTASSGYVAKPTRQRRATA